MSHKADRLCLVAHLCSTALQSPPVGTYNPDWIISFMEGTVKPVYFVAETKGSMSTMELREIERTKIQCALKFFDEINQKIDPKKVKYDGG